MSDVVVIGGGVVGMMSARALALRGANVTLLERGKLGAESSWAGGGILSALIPWQTADAINHLILWSHKYYPLLAQELISETGIDVQWYQSGMVVMTSNVDEARAWSERVGIEAELLSDKQVASLLPNTDLSEKSQSAIYLPGVAQIRNPRLIKALVLSLQKLGIEIHEQCQVEKIEKHNKRVTAVKTANQTFSANHIVLTAGAWAAQLLPELVQRQVEPIRGEMLLYKAEPDLLSSVVVADGGYLIPRRDGYILCGSTVEDVGFDCSTTRAALIELSTRAECLLPGLKSVPIVGHWAGLRPGSEDGVPVISRSREYDNLYANCGHFRNGLAMAPASAQLVSDLVEDVEPTINSIDYTLS